MSGHLPADTMTGPGASSDGSWTLLPLATAPLHHGGCPPFLTLLPIFFVKGLGTGGGGGMGEAHTSGCVWEGCLGSRVSPCLPSIRSPFLLPTEPRFYSSLHPLFTQPRVSSMFDFTQEYRSGACKLDLTLTTVAGWFWACHPNPAEFL